MHKPMMLMLLAASGCGPYLRYRSQPPAPPLTGKVIVEVRDAREPNRGGNMKEEVGTQTGAFGVPTPIRVESPSTVAATVAQLVGEAAQSAGVAVVPPGTAGATSKVVVEVQRFWCTGYNPVYKGDVIASFTVFDPAGAQVRVPGQPVKGEDGGMDCRSIFKKSLTDFFMATKALFAMEPIRSAATGMTPAGTPPPPAQ